MGGKSIFRGEAKRSKPSLARNRLAGTVEPWYIVVIGTAGGSLQQAPPAPRRRVGGARSSWPLCLELPPPQAPPGGIRPLRSAPLAWTKRHWYIDFRRVPGGGRSPSSRIDSGATAVSRAFLAVGHRPDRWLRASRGVAWTWRRAKANSRDAARNSGHPSMTPVSTVASVKGEAL
jgi:hypothetical protein